MTKLKLEWREAARGDLLGIVDYISDDNPDAALAFLGDIEAKVDQLAETPKIYQAGRLAGTREMLARKNYVIVYTEDERAVTILRVLHSAQMWPR